MGVFPGGGGGRGAQGFTDSKYVILAKNMKIPEGVSVSLAVAPTRLVMIPVPANAEG